MTQKELEMRVIAHICTFEDDMMFLLSEGISEDDFTYIENGKTPLLKTLFLSAVNYYKKFGRLLSQEALESKIKQKDEESSTNKTLSLFVQSMVFELDHNSFPMLVKDLRSKRMYKVVQDIMHTIDDSLKTENPSSVFEKLKDKILETESDLRKDTKTGNRVYLLNESSNDIMDKYLDRKNYPEKYKGMNVGLSVLDTATNGFKASTFNLVVAPSGGGKSITLLNWAAEVFHRKNNVLFFSLEMPQEQVVARYISRELCIDYKRFYNGQLFEDEEQILRDKLPDILGSKSDDGVISSNDSTFVIYTNFDNPDVDYIEDMIRRHQKMYGKVDAIFIDYLNNMRSREVLKSGGQEWAHSGICAKGIRRIAANYELTAFSAQQINRSGLERGRKTMDADPSSFNPRQEDISASQTAFHDADSVISGHPDIANFKMYYSQVKGRDFVFEPFSVNYYPTLNRIVDPSADDTKFMLSPMEARMNDEYRLSTSPENDVQLFDDFGEV